MPVPRTLAFHVRSFIRGLKPTAKKYAGPTDLSFHVRIIYCWIEIQLENIRKHFLYARAVGPIHFVAPAFMPGSGVA
jgi:hypothetical protein